MKSKVSVQRKRHIVTSSAIDTRSLIVSKASFHYQQTNGLGPPKRNPDKYSITTINQMLAVADEDTKDVILFLLSTGFRDEEVAYTKTWVFRKPRSMCIAGQDSMVEAL